ncbi:MAG: hypothetical protein ORN28_06690, partial [Rhodoferax sp.]|nr:hypothetical protein [Rhodoferax sp.]
ARSGVHIARSSMAQWVGICGVRLKPLADALQAFFDLMFGYKREVVPSEQLAQAKIELTDIKKTLDGHSGWAGVAVFFVSGTAPDRSIS